MHGVQEVLMRNLGNPSAAPSGSTRSSLLRRVQADDQRAWTQLVDLYGPLLYHWCSRSGLRPREIEDVFQEIVRSVAANIKGFTREGGKGSFRGWLRTITTNKVRDHYRRQPPGVRVQNNVDSWLDQVAEPIAEDDSSTDLSDRQMVLRSALELVRGEFEERTWQAFWRAVVDG
jgi:RNA polymerase sigma-70 factor (ECF subfamily)